MANQILNVAVHDLRDGGGGLETHLGTSDLAVTPTVARLVEELHDRYSRRGGKSHGKFSIDVDNYPMEGFLRDHVEGQGFDGMTERMMGTLQLQARRKPGATGGHVFFARFDDDQGRYLLIAIINDKLSAALTSDLRDVREVQHLDMDGFRFAGRIAIDRWLAGEQRYIGFLKGKGDVAEYFQEFLGCEAAVKERKETLDLVGALRSFADLREMDLEQRKQFMARARDVCGRAARGRVGLDFEALANELVPEDPQSLLSVLADPARGLTDGFVPEAGAIGLLVTYRARTPLWKLEFDRKALTEGKIEYDREEGALIIKDLPEELARELASDLRRDG